MGVFGGSVITERLYIDVKQDFIKKKKISCDMSGWPNQLACRM